MKITLNQVSALQKIRVDDAINASERSSHTVLQGQRLSYQVVIGTKGIREKTRRIWIESPLKDYIRLYRVKEVIVDVPSRELVSDEDYLLTSAGNLPDVLVPLELQGNYAALSGDNVVIWVKIDIPKMKFHLPSFLYLRFSFCFLLQGHIFFHTFYKYLCIF